MGLNTKPPHQGIFSGRGNLHSELGRRNQCVLDDTVGRNHRCYAGETEIKRGTQGVDVCPGSLSASLLILFDRGTAMTERDRKGVLERIRRSGASEIQKTYPSLNRFVFFLLSCAAGSLSACTLPFFI